METCPIRASWQAILENKLNRAEVQGILQNLNSDDDDSDDGFPHRELPIITRNEKIRRSLDARQRKRKIEAEQD